MLSRYVVILVLLFILPVDYQAFCNDQPTLAVKNYFRFLSFGISDGGVILSIGFKYWSLFGPV